MASLAARVKGIVSEQHDRVRLDFQRATKTEGEA